jgi:phage baseplate assembly protein V
MNGLVVAIDPAKYKVRVQFPDRDGMVSDWLPVGVRKAVGDLDYWLPDKGTQVACLMDERCVAGVVLCALYSDVDLPPVSNPDLFYKKFKDGTVIQYDRATHKLFADVKGNIEVKATGTLTAGITGNSTITTPTCTLNGNLVVNGTAVVSGNINGGANIVAAVNVADVGGAKTMLGMRTTYNAHNHTSNIPGAATSLPLAAM